MSYNADNNLISVREAAKLCGRNPETVRRWIWGGKLPAEKLGNQLFIKKSALDSYCRETAVLQYDTGTRLEVPEQPRDNIEARTGKEFDAVSDIEGEREERMAQIEKSLPENGAIEYSTQTDNNLLERVREIRNKILSRTGILFDAPKDLMRLREEREDELLRLR